LKPYGHHSARGRLTLATTGAALAACAALATMGSGVASAAVRPHATRTTTAASPKVTEIDWGSANGQPVELYTLHGGGGATANISSFGADIQSIDVPDKQGKLTDVVLGFPNLADYVADFEQGSDQVDWPISGSTSGSGDTYFGATIGEYANRIAGGTFPLNGTTYKLDLNNGPNDLHGGYLGWNTAIWSGTPSVSGTTAKVTMSESFPAGTGCDLTLTPGCTGFPTAIDASVTFVMQKNNSLNLYYSATNESPSLSTVINLTNHSYFNLGGQASGSVAAQNLAINGNAYQPTNQSQIPAPGSNGSYFQNVKGTPFDFESMHQIGKYETNLQLPDGTSGPIRQLQYAHGYDFNWVLNAQNTYRLDAVAQDTGTGITLWQYTDQPGVQVYTSNYLQGDLPGATGSTYRSNDAFTLETNHYPDSPNHQNQAGWPSVVLGPGQTFTSHTADRFGIEPASFYKTVNFR
jgi:aldose 1-epimerase